MRGTDCGAGRAVSSACAFPACGVYPSETFGSHTRAGRVAQGDAPRPSSQEAHGDGASREIVRRGATSIRSACALATRRRRIQAPLMGGAQRFLAEMQPFDDDRRHS